jgi:hypothetical protein
MLLYIPETVIKQAGIVLYDGHNYLDMHIFTSDTFHHFYSATLRLSICLPAETLLLILMNL